MKKTWLGIIKDLQKIALVLVICGIITTCVCYFYRDLIYKFLTHPLSDALHKDYAEIFIYTSIFESFIADISISVYSSIFILLPLLLICIYWFVAKSLYRKEKQMFALILVLVMFLTFVACGTVYFMLLPHFIKYFVVDAKNAVPMLKISDYISCLFHLFFIISTVFQFPVVVFLLVKTKLLDRKFLKKHRKQAIVVIFVLAAIVTPPDVCSQIVVAILLLVVYELTNFFIRK